MRRRLNLEIIEADCYSRDDEWLESVNDLLNDWIVWDAKIALTDMGDRSDGKTLTVFILREKL